MIEFVEVSKYYQNQLVFDQINCHFPMNSFNCLIGANGAGKTTLFNLILNQIYPDEGQILFLQQPLGILKQNLLEQHRRHIGNIFENHRFLKATNAETNLLLPLTILGKKKSEYAQKLDMLVEQLGLSSCLSKMMNELSKSEQQRLSVARAFIHDPILILADEPTQHLNIEVAKVVVKLLYEAYREGTTVIVASQDKIILSYPELNIWMIQNYQIRLN